jgi:hypothetical protein
MLFKSGNNSNSVNTHTHNNNKTAATSEAAEDELQTKGEAVEAGPLVAPKGVLSVARFIRAVSAIGAVKYRSC